MGGPLLCPGLVATPLSDNARMNMPSTRGIPAEHVGRCTVDAVRNDQFYIFTHPEYASLVELRFAEIRAAMAAAPAASPPDDLAYLGKGVLAMAKR